MWFNYPVEKNILRFYKYKFKGVKKPIVIEAFNKQEARRKVFYVMEKIPQLKELGGVIDESLTLPIFGRTTKNIKSVKNIWVGNLTSSGWMPITEFDKLGYE
jgi:hypothetical protein